MARYSRSPSPDYKRRKSYHNSRGDSPSPTRRHHQARERERDSHRDRERERDRPRDRDRERERDRDRDYRDRDRDRDRRRDDRDYDRRRDRTHREKDRDRDRDRESERDRNDRGRKRSRSLSRDAPPSAPTETSKQSTPAPAPPPEQSTSTSTPAPAPTLAPVADVSTAPIPEPIAASVSATTTAINSAAATPPATNTTKPSGPEDEKMRAKRERLEAWKKQQALAKEQKAKGGDKASTTNGTSGVRPTGALSRPGGIGIKGLPQRPEAGKSLSKAARSMDDTTESNRKLVKLGDMPAVDLSMDTNANGIGENLEAEDDDEPEPMQIDSTNPTPAVEEEEEEDPLDAFMSGVKEEVKKVNAEDRKRMAGNGEQLGITAEDAEDDVEETRDVDELDATELRPEDILALAAKKAKKKDLAVVDHDKIKYEPFRKAFYHPPPDVAAMTDDEADLLRLSLDGIKIRGLDCPKPVTKWSHCGLPSSCLDVIKRLGYTAPTSIQSQAIPAIMSGRDVIGVAKTGSGKTIAFLLPLFRHIKDQRPLETMEGPMAIVMTPTRELAVQIHRECKPFLKVLNLRAVCAYGGSPIKDQIAEMKKGCEIIVCTPGRMIDLLTANSGRVTNLRRVTYLVLDEADRMFDMGFEPQVMKIVNNIRPDRQTVLFSATFPKQMDSLARKILRKPLEITVGGRSVVAAEIDQIVEVRTEESKFNRLLEILGQTYNEDSEARTLIFVDRQEAADNLLRELMRKGYVCMSLHGGKDQVDRDATIADFKAGVVPIVIATSVAARGLDVKQLKLVINYDAPNHMEDYVHRAGRTGRAGNKGTCVTFITPEQERYSVDIFRALEASKATIPSDLEELAKGFLDKVKAGKAQSYVGAGFGGKGLDKFDQERDAKERAQRAAYGEAIEEKPKVEEEASTPTTKEDDMTFGNFKVEIRKGPAPDSSKTVSTPAGAAARWTKAKDDEAKVMSNLKAAQEAAARITSKDSAAYRQAQSVVAKFNAQLRATKLMAQSQSQLDDAGRKPKDPDATDFHAIIPINDYPQKARWRVTNKETMVQLIDMTGASVTNKGIYYEPGKEPPLEGPPKLHLLVESNDEFRVEQAVREIKRLLIEASTAALAAEQRNPTATAGRYSVV
ncbi:pre-mRNA processing RNA-helicase [Rhizoctonia solani]|uniref:RNA helicase n=1 Tax=Rhizoctonia solani TaxID=456999 RepID=A0A8H7HCH0_9AGAM|nr:helicase superfamily c-terminal domain [Rhizoctonia solani]